MDGSDKKRVLRIGDFAVLFREKKGDYSFRDENCSAATIGKEALLEILEEVADVDGWYALGIQECDGSKRIGLEVKGADFIFSLSDGTQLYVRVELEREEATALLIFLTSH